MATAVRSSPRTAPALPRSGHILSDPRHGPLPPLLLALTAVTGLVDAVSILRLGRVFVANMTGNVVFTGFALTGAPGFSLSASLFALAGFLTGAAIGGALATRAGHDRALLLLSAAGSELTLVAAALAVAAPATALTAVPRDIVAGLLAVAVLPALAGITGTAYLHPDALAAGFRTAALISGAMCAAGGLLAAFTITNPVRVPRPAGAAAPEECLHCGLDAPPLTTAVSQATSPE